MSVEWEYITIPVPKTPGTFDHEFSFWLDELPLGNKGDKSNTITLPNGKVVSHHYKDPESKAFQARVRNCFYHEAYNRGLLLDYPFDGWCRIFVHLFYPKPAGWHPAMTPESSKIPDNDNVHKSIADGLNALRLVRHKRNEEGKCATKVTHFGPYNDDKQIITNFVSKSYADHPGARIIIWFYRRLPRESARKTTARNQAHPLSPEFGAGAGQGQSQAHDPDFRTYRQLLDRYG